MVSKWSGVPTFIFCYMPFSSVIFFLPCIHRIPQIQWQCFLLFFYFGFSWLWLWNLPHSFILWLNFPLVVRPELSKLTFNPAGFDHQHPEVYEHCKRLLLHLLVVQGANSNVQSVAMVLLRNRDFNESRVLTVKPVAPEMNLTGQSKQRRHIPPSFNVRMWNNSGNLKI